MVIKKRIGLFLSALLVVSIIPINYYVQNRAVEKYQTIQIDGHSRDWKNVTERKSNDSDVKWWKVCSDDKYMYLAAMTVNGGKNSKFFDKHIDVEGFGYVYAHYSNSTKEPIVMDDKGKYIGNEAQYSFRDEGQGTDIFNEVKIPLSHIGGKKSVTFAGTTVSAADIQDLKNVKNADWNPDDKEIIDGKETYNGIKIDGKFDDWKNGDVSIKNLPGNPNVNGVAAVWDGINLYIYLKENDKKEDGNLVKDLLKDSGFAIQTDKNEKTLFTLKEVGKGQFYVGLGKDAKKQAGASVRYSNHEYEICITNSLIEGVTANTKHLTFALHTANGGDIPIIRNIKNIKGAVGKEKKRPLIDTSIINYDGNFSEWEQYPKSVFKDGGAKSTEGTAYYKEDGINPFTHKKEGVIIGHFKTFKKNKASAWLRSGKVTIKGNGKIINLTIRYEKGNALLMPSKTFDTACGVNGKTAKRNHTKVMNYFTLVDSRVANRTIGARNQNKWKKHYIGKMQGTIDQDGNIEMEYIVPMKEVAGNGEVEISIPQIGNFKVGGASTGAILGILLAFAVVGGVLLYRKKKEGKFFPGMDDDEKKKGTMIAAA